MTRLTRRTVLLNAGAAARCGVSGARAEGPAPGVPAEPGLPAGPSLPAGLPAGGVNLSGADFGPDPGKHGTEYLYPPSRRFDYLRALGFTLGRLPFKWERLQPELNQSFAPDEL